MKVIKKNLTFGTAMNALLKGAKITRFVWDGYWFIPSKMYRFNYKTPSLEVNCSPKPTETTSKDVAMNPMIVAKLKDNLGYAPAQPYQTDMLAHDWEIIK